jgi:hypothetical protein
LALVPSTRAEGDALRVPEKIPNGEPAADDIGPVSETKTQRKLRLPSGRPSQRTVVVGLFALLVAPLIVAAFRHRDWVPVLDLAMTELRVRDVWSAHPPLIGLPGRIGSLAEQGSHPGPLSFWAMWPAYRLFGASSSSLQVAAVLMQTLAIGVVLWVACRRGGVGLALGAAAAVALLVRAYGVELLTEPWNLHLPLLWWMAFLLAAWAVACGDLRLLPIVVFAGSFCAQTHVSYVPLCVGVGVVAVGVGLIARPTEQRDAASRAHALRWVLIAGAVGVVLWLLPVFQQLTSSRGNFSTLIEFFRDPPEAPIGVQRGIELLLVGLNPWRLVSEEQPATGSLADAAEATSGSLVPGVMLLVGWAIAVFTAWRLRDRALLRLHMMLGVALVLSAISFGRISGYPWYYLTFSALVITAMLLLATGWTATEFTLRHLRAPRRRPATLTAGVALFAFTLTSSVLLVPSAVAVDVPASRLSTSVERLVRPTARALSTDTPPARGRDAPYLVTWIDALAIGSQGFALVNELERRGFDVGVPSQYRVPATGHRVMKPADASAVVYLATGVHIDATRSRPGYREIAFVDPRTPAQRAEYERLRSRALELLDRAGQSDLSVLVDEHVFALTFDERAPELVRRIASRMLKLGLPAAVFLVWPDEIESV